MWRRLFEDCNKKPGQEIERLRQDYKERSEQMALTTAVEKVIPARSIPRGQSPMELLTPREMSQTTETRLPTATDRVTIPDPSDTLGDPVVEQMVRKLIETAGRLVANKNAPGSGVTAPYGTIDDTGRVRLSQTVFRQGISDVTPLMGSSKTPERRIQKMPAKKESRVMDVQKNNQLRYNFTGVPETDPRACFNRAIWNPAANLQQPPLEKVMTRSMHQEMNSEATSSGSPLRAAVPPKRAKVAQKVQTNQTIQDLDEMNDELKSTKKELDEMTRSMLQMEEDRDMWRKLFEDCNKKQGQEIERLRQEYKERSEQVALTTAVEKVIPARDIPRGQSPMELLTPREMSQTTETRLPTATDRVTIPDPSDTLGDPVVEQMVRKLIETAGRLVANKNAPGSGVTAPYGTIDDTGRVRLSQTVFRQGISDVTPLMGSSKTPERRIQKMPAKKESRVMDVQKNNQLRYNFTGVPETDPRACFNRATWNPAANLQQPPLGTSHLILGDSLVRVLSNLRTSWVTTVMDFGGATTAQLYRMVELMNPGRIPNVMILVGTNDISRGSDEQEALWESMMVFCLLPSGRNVIARY